METTLRLIAALSAGALFALSACATTYDPPGVGPRPRRSSSIPAGVAPAPTPDRGESFDPDRGLRGYLDHGLANNADLRAAFQAWHALAERVEQVSTLDDPRLTFHEFLEEPQTRTGPQERRFGVSQALPWPGELDARADAAARRADAAWARVRAERLRVASEIEVAYHDYAYLGTETAIARRLLELLRGLEPLVRQRVSVGAGQEDLLRLQVEIGRLEDDVASLERRRPVASARLEQTLTLRDRAQPLPIPALAEPPVVPLAASEAFQVALARSPRLQELDEELAASVEHERVVGYRRKPAFAVGVDYIQTGDAFAPATPGSGDDPVLLSFGLSLPIWTSSYAAAEREARHASRGWRERIAAAESSLRASVAGEAFRVDDAARRIALYRDSLLPRASEALELSMAAYRTGTASVLDLIDSERALLEFELSYWRACRELLQGEARLRALMGVDE